MRLTLPLQLSIVALAIVATAAMSLTLAALPSGDVRSLVVGLLPSPSGSFSSISSIIGQLALATFAVLFAVAIRQYAFHFLLLFVFLIPWETAGILSGDRDLTIMPMLGAFMALLWAIGLIERRFRFVWFPAAWVLFAFFLWLIVAVLSSDNPREEFRNVFSYGMLALLVFVTVSLADEAVKLQRIITVVIISSISASLYSLALAQVFGIGISTAEFNRLAGVTVNANRMGFIATIGIILIASHFYVTRKWRIWTVAGILICGSALVRSVSLGDILGAVAGIFVILLFAKRNRPGFGVVFGALWKIPAVGFVLILLWQVPVIHESPVATRIQNQVDRVKNEPVYRWGTSRGAIWIAGFEVIKENPMFGVGESQFSTSLAERVPRILGYVLGSADRKNAHNAIISVIGGYGIIAGLFIAGFIGIIVWNIATTLTKFIGRKLDVLIYSGIGVSLLSWWVGTLVVLMGSDFQRHKFVWLLIGLSVAYSLIGHETDSRKDPAETDSKRSQTLTAGFKPESR